MKNRSPFVLILGLLVSFAGSLPAQPADTNNAPTNAPIQVEDVDTNAPPETTDDFEPKPGGVFREAVVVFGRNVHLKSNDVAGAVVVIGGSAKIEGKVRDAVVVIGGDIDVTGQIRDAAVAIFGDIRAGKGAKFDGEAVAVGGRVESGDEVTFRHSPVEIDFGGFGRGLREWIFQCVFKLRPLAPQVGWVWAVWAAFFVIYLLVALILPVPVRACAAELTRRPATTFFMGLLAKILLPLVITILSLTVIGAFVVPFLFAALLFGAIVGKVALFEFLGASLGRRFGTNVFQNSLVAFLIGILLITLLYMVPVLGLITFGVVSVWGLGGAVTAAYWGLKRETPEKTPPSPLPPPGPNPPSSPATGPAPETLGSSPTATSSVPPSSSALPANIPEAFAYPRASFWERMGAGFLDVVLVGFLMGVLHKPPLGFLASLAYFAGMWAWKGTTVGGVVLGLKVVRLDGYPVTFVVSIVRALAAAFSIVVFFLGFLWIVWDREKQGWHDKIAGTVVIRLPKGAPLVML